MTFGRMQDGQATRIALLVASVLLAVGAVLAANMAGAAEAAVGLGTADAFAVLGGQTVTNTGPSVITGNLGVSPGSSITGFPPGVVNGQVHSTDAVALQAQSDMTTAYNDAAGRSAEPANTFAVPTDLGGMTLVQGVYKAASSLGITGTLTLDAQGDPNAVFIFQAGSTVITAVDSTVALVNGAQACNVFWQVGSSATLEVGSTFVGSVIALTSISAKTGAVVQGRLLARNGAITLDNNVITATPCAETTTTTGGGATTTTAGGGATTTTTAAGGGGGATTTTAAGGGGATATTTALPLQAVTSSTTTSGGGAVVTTATTIRSGATNSGTSGSTTTAGGALPLPRTGSSPWWGTLAGGLAIASGLALVLAARKRPPWIRTDWTDDYRY